MPHSHTTTSPVRKHETTVNLIFPPHPLQESRRHKVERMNFPRNVFFALLICYSSVVGQSLHSIQPETVLLLLLLLASFSYKQGLVRLSVVLSTMWSRPSYSSFSWQSPTVRSSSTTTHTYSCTNPQQHGFGIISSTGINGNPEQRPRECTIPHSLHLRHPFSFSSYLTTTDGWLVAVV